MPVTDKTRTILSISASIALSAGFAALLTYLLGSSLQTILGVGGLTVVLLVVGVLKSRYRKFDRAIETFFSKYFRFSFWLLVTLAPAVFFTWLSDFTLATAPILQLILFVLWAGLLITILMFMATERKRGKLFQFLERIGVLAPYVYSFNAFVIAAQFFATLTYLMAGLDLLTFTNLDGVRVEAAELAVGRLRDFYVWHFLDAIPLLKINQTLRWEIQLSYASSAVGFIVLLFKVAVILPVISAFRGYWKHRQAANERAEDS